MSSEVAKIDKLVEEGARRLLARTSESYSLVVDRVIPRVRASLEKYLLKDDPNAAAQAVTEFIDQLQGDDLCLVIACEGGEAAAWNDLVERYSPTVRSAARSAAGNEDAADDVAQSIWAELHGLRVRADGKPSSKLAYYSGRGSLAGWLRAVVAQLAVDQHRKQSRFVQTEEDADFDRLGSVTVDGKEVRAAGSTALNPEDALSHKRERVEMEKALARSLAGLADEDRLLVKLYYFDGLRLREAGAVLGVHEATASRRLARVHVELRQRVEEILTEECGWTKRETEVSFRELGLHLESDIEPLLTAKQPQANLSSD
ncbi:MAG TPA: sigma-70 family RNA polymerase sigma factor [Pyrinomonadaceae bacterium]|nr:sigma-70 family RNA polymerase sigma factor [Pyrinomonadaceae bacterium]